MLGKRSNDIDSYSTSTEKDATTSENMFVFDPEFWRYIDSGLLEKVSYDIIQNSETVSGKTPQKIFLKILFYLF